MKKLGRIKDYVSKIQSLEPEDERYETITDYIKQCPDDERTEFEYLLFRFISIEILVEFLDSYIKETYLEDDEFEVLDEFYNYFQDLEKKAFKQIGLW